MNCLYCGEKISDDALKEERTSQWHNSCVKKFFGTHSLPEVSFSEDVIEKLATETTSKGYTVPGVQKKLSLHLTDDDKKNPRLTLVDYPTGYILKPQTKEFMALPEAEALAMSMAKATGIQAVPFALMKSADGGFSYITKRIDRIKKKTETVSLAMEDFCQLDGRLTADKYKGSYERCTKIISRYSQSPGLDLSEIFLRLVFSFIIGNSDMHLKNFSLIETAERSSKYHLSEAYDLLPVNVIIPQDTEEFALTMNGKKRNFHRKDFLIFADNCGINKKSAEKMIEKVLSMHDTYLQMCQESYLPEEMKEALNALIDERVARL